MRLPAEPAASEHVTSGLRESVELFLWSLPVLILWSVAVVAMSARLARWLETTRPIAVLLFVSLGFILSATLTPTSIVLGSAGVSDTGCDLSRLLPLGPLVFDFDAVVNILLFVLFGLALGLLPRTRRNGLIVLASFSLTFIIEAVQLLWPELGRGCESADMVDNTVGLVIGLAAGVALQAVLARRGNGEGAGSG